MIPVDNSSKFGTYKPSSLTWIIILITRSVGKIWLSKRIIFLLRRIAIALSKDCIDTNLFNSSLRMYTRANVSEKRALFSPQIFEEEEREYIGQRAKDNSVFIDIGANIGLYSFSVGSSYKKFKNTKIYSIEPHPYLFKRLLYNVSLNNDIPIHAREMAIMDKSGKFNLDTPNENLGQGVISKTGEHLVVGKKLSEFILDEGIKEVSAMKIDVEGNEEKVIIPFLKESKDKYLPLIIVIENNKRFWKKDLIKLLEKRGYVIKKRTRMNYILELNN